MRENMERWIMRNMNAFKEVYTEADVERLKAKGYKIVEHFPAAQPSNSQSEQPGEPQQPPKGKGKGNKPPKGNKAESDDPGKESDNSGEDEDAPDDVQRDLNDGAEAESEGGATDRK